MSSVTTWRVAGAIVAVAVVVLFTAGAGLASAPVVRVVHIPAPPCTAAAIAAAAQALETQSVGPPAPPPTQSPLKETATPPTVAPPVTPSHTGDDRQTLVSTPASANEPGIEAAAPTWDLTTNASNFMAPGPFSLRRYSAPAHPRHPVFKMIHWSRDPGAAEPLHVTLGAVYAMLEALDAAYGPGETNTSRDRVLPRRPPSVVEKDKPFSNWAFVDVIRRYGSLGQYLRVTHPGVVDEVRVWGPDPDSEAVMNSKDGYLHHVIGIVSLLPVGTVVFVYLHDRDAAEGVHFIQSPGDQRFILDGVMRNLRWDDVIAHYPDNVFAMAPNPTVIDPMTGHLSPRMIPLPNPEALDSCGDSGFVPWEERDNVIRWRGVTTGPFQNYEESDRFKVVARLHGVQNFDVRFNAEVQGVTVKPEYLGGRVSAGEMARGRVTLDIDGNGNAWEGLRWKLGSGSAVVKIATFRWAMWYYSHLTDGHDVVLIHPDDPDMITKLTALANNATEAKRIGDNGRAFYKEHLECPRGWEYLESIPARLQEFRLPFDSRPKGGAAFAATYQPRITKVLRR